LLKKQCQGHRQFRQQKRHLQAEPEKFHYNGQPQAETLSAMPVYVRPKKATDPKKEHLHGHLISAGPQGELEFETIHNTKGADIVLFRLR
jgi:hypothetical protein